MADEAVIKYRLEITHPTKPGKMETGPDRAAYFQCTEDQMGQLVQIMNFGSFGGNKIEVVLDK